MRELSAGAGHVRDWNLVQLKSTVCLLYSTYDSLILTHLLEICYNILYVSRHNRSLSDPWSLRQTGVYHQLSEEMKKSRWMFLNLPSQLKLQLGSFIESRLDRCFLVLHVKVLQTLASSWPDYIEYLRTELRKQVRLVRKAQIFNKLTIPG